MISWVFHVYSMGFFCFFLVHGDSTSSLFPPQSSRVLDDPGFFSESDGYQRWIGWYVTYIYMIYMIYVTFTKVALLIGITGPHCYFRRKVMSSTCTPVCWSVRRRWMRPKNQLGLSENKVPPFHLIVNHSSLACITLYSLSYNVCII